MGSGLGHPDLALYRLVRSGESGLNLRLDDLFDREYEGPSTREIISSLFTGKPLKFIKRAWPSNLIERLLSVQKGVDKKVQEELDKAKRGMK